MAETERQEFEAWAKDKVGQEYVVRDESGEYAVEYAEGAWAAWQERARRATPRDTFPHETGKMVHEVLQMERDMEALMAEFERDMEADMGWSEDDFTRTRYGDQYETTIVQSAWLGYRAAVRQRGKVEVEAESEPVIEWFWHRDVFENFIWTCHVDGNAYATLYQCLRGNSQRWVAMRGGEPYGDICDAVLYEAKKAVEQRILSERATA